MKRSSLRRTAGAAFVGTVLAALTMAAPAPAGAVVAVPPAPSGGHSLFAFVDSDAVVGVNAPNTTVQVDLVRAGSIIATANVASDFAGNVVINHPGGVCWSTPGTPDIAPGDVVQMTNGALVEGTQVQNIHVTPQTGPVNGDFTVTGSALDVAGAPLTVAGTEGRLQTKGGQTFIETSKNSSRAGGPARTANTTMAIDAAGNMTATHHFTQGSDQSLASQAVDLLAWLGRDGTGLTEKTVAEAVPAPAICGAPVQFKMTTTAPKNGWVTAADIAAASPGTTVSGVSQDASAVTVTITDSANNIVTATGTPAPAAGSQTWTVPFSAAQLTGLLDGTLTVSESFATGATTTPGANSTITKDVVAPTAPTATPAAGTYTSAQQVTLATTDAAAVIHFTTDGTPATATTPTTGTAVAVDVTKTVRAVAVDTAGNVSPESTLSYVINIPAPAPPPPPPAPVVPQGLSGGYRLVAADGGIFTFGNAPFAGSTGGQPLNAPIITAARTPSGNGYWLVASDGGIFSFGDAQFFGSTGGFRLNQPIVGMSATPSGHGYWLVARDGGIFSFGDAAFFGSTGGRPLNQPIVSMTATPSGHGYWLTARDGGIFAFGDAAFLGSTGGFHLNQPIITMAATPSGNGYWLVARDGGIFAFGDARFLGSTGGQHLNQAIIAMNRTASGNGYWLVAADGGIFSFGDAQFFGSTGGFHLNQPIIGMV